MRHVCAGPQLCKVRYAKSTLIRVQLARPSKEFSSSGRVSLEFGSPLLIFQGFYLLPDLLFPVSPPSPSASRSVAAVPHSCAQFPVDYHQTPSRCLDLFPTPPSSPACQPVVSMRSLLRVAHESCFYMYATHSGIILIPTQGFFSLPPLHSIRGGIRYMSRTFGCGFI